MSDDILKLCKHTGFNPDQRFLDSEPVDFETWIDWVLCKPQKGRTTLSASCGDGYITWSLHCQTHCRWASLPLQNVTILGTPTI
jgi:hypothetical protein